MGGVAFLPRLVGRIRPVSPLSHFHSNHYLRHNQRRQEHLATLGLPLAGRNVLEVGAGIGDHTSYFIDRGCTITITDGRKANVDLLSQRFPGRAVRHLDLNAPDPALTERFDVVYCYGVLYHLERPAAALAYLADRCDGLLLVETCVTPGEGVALNPIREQSHRPSQAISGCGCRPTRQWVMVELRRYFDHVYVTTTQPWHEEFPLDWSLPSEPDALTRAVFVASRTAIETPLLTEEIPQHQTRE